MKSLDTKCVQAGYDPKNGEPRVLPIAQRVRAEDIRSELYVNPKREAMRSTIGGITL